MTTIGSQDPVLTSDVLTITLAYGALLPEFFLSEDPVRQAIAPLGHNIMDIDVDTLVGFRKIIVRLHPAEDAQAGVIGNQVANAIREYFTTVWSVSAEKYELGSGETIFSTQSAISLGSIAILAVVGGGAFFYVTGGRK